MRADKRAQSWQSLRDRLVTKHGRTPQNSVPSAAVPEVEPSVVQLLWSAEHFPALDLMANWTNDRPSMSQILDGRASQDAVDVSRQVGDAATKWRSDNASN